MSQKIIPRSEADRRWVDLLLERIKPRFSKTTGWLHRSSAPYRVDIGDNAAYALLLMRTHLMDPMLEGQRLLSHLLHFQTPSGFFSLSPLEYPFTYRKEQNRDLEITLLMIQTHYAPLFPKELASRLEQAIDCLSKAVKTLPKQEFPYGSREKLGVKLDWEISSGSLESAEEIYHAPLVEEVYEAITPKPGLFELATAYLFQGPLPEGDFIIRGARYKIEGVKAIHPELWTDMEGRIWKLSRNQMVFVNHVAADSQGSSFHLFRFPLQKGSLIAQFSGCEVRGAEIDQGLSMEIEVPDGAGEADLLRCFVSKGAILPPQIDGVRANTWRVGQTIVLETESGKISLRIDLLRGECNCFGQLSLGFREGQTQIGGLLEPHADWTITLRRIRSENALLRLTIHDERSAI